LFGDLSVKSMSNRLLSFSPGTLRS